LRVCGYPHTRNNWLFAGSLRAGQRAAAVMSLVHSARLNGHDVYAYLKDILERASSAPRQPRYRAASSSVDAGLINVRSASIKMGSAGAYIARMPKAE
jgi:hypothetical protein